MRRGIALDGDQREEVKKYRDLGVLPGYLIECAQCGKTLTIVMFEMGRTDAYDLLYKKKHRCSRIHNKKKRKKRRV